MKASKQIIWLSVMVSAVAVGCKPAGTPTPATPPLAYLNAPDTVPISQWQRISEAARKTVDKHNIIEFDKVISEDKWERAIRELKPIHVYAEPGGNVLIVLKESIDIEEGLYVRVPRSSYHPHQAEPTSRSSEEYEILAKVYSHDPANGIRYDSIWRYRILKEEPTAIETLASQIGTATLSRAGQVTLRQYAKATETQEATIPSEFWIDEIQRLIPVRVYQHRGHIMVVLRDSDNVEEGLCIHNWLSALHAGGVDKTDGFMLENLGHSVFKYTKDYKSADVR